MFKDNLVQLRKMLQMTQEEVADKLGVTRQSVAKWEAGESTPDLDKCKLLADIFGVSLDDLANYEPDDNMGFAIPPKGKHLFKMEAILNKANQKMDALEKMIREYEEFQPEIARLEEYYTSQQWKDDFSMDEKGELPEKLKRGVLSEDGIYNMLERNKELMERLLGVKENENY